MRICHAIFSSPWSPLAGGGQLAVHAMATAMAKAGHEVHVIYSLGPGEGCRETLAYQAHFTRCLNWRDYNFDAWQHARKLEALISRERFDMVIGHSVNAVLFPTICRRWNAPFVYLFHDREFPVPRRGLPGIGDQIRFFDYSLVRRALAAADVVVTFSAWARALVMSKVGLPGERVIVCRPGIDRAWFQIVRKPRRNGTFLHWGRLEPKKNVDHLLRAFHALRSSTATSARLVVVGTGPSESSLRRFAAHLGLEQCVDWMGLLPPHAIRELCVDADMAVFPTQVESFGLAIAEACAAGIPVLAYASGAVPELIHHGVTGSLVPTGAIEQLTSTMLECITAPSRFEAMSRCPSNVIRTLDWDRNAREVVALHGGPRAKPIST